MTERERLQRRLDSHSDEYQEMRPASRPVPPARSKKKRKKKRVTTSEELLSRRENVYREEVEMEPEFGREKWKVTTRIINILLVVGCVYIIFLIYGVAVTQYQYNDNGTVSAQKVSVSDIKEQKNYEAILVQYEECRVLYEKILLLNYRLNEGLEEEMALAPEYEALLDDVENLAVKMDAASVDSKYEAVKTLLYTWLTGEHGVGVFLQNAANGLSQNSDELKNHASQDLTQMYSDFSVITQNIVVLGSDINGIDLTDIREWTPENYVEETINGTGN